MLASHREAGLEAKEFIDWRGVRDGGVVLCALGADMDAVPRWSSVRFTHRSGR